MLKGNNLREGKSEISDFALQQDILDSKIIDVAPPRSIDCLLATKNQRRVPIGTADLSSSLREMSRAPWYRTLQEMQYDRGWSCSSCNAPRHVTIPTLQALFHVVLDGSPKREQRGLSKSPTVIGLLYGLDSVLHLPQY